MQYRKDKKGNDISILGYGCMRFSRRGTSIDLNKLEKEIMTAIDLGVNYFDTAYIYIGSEAALGEVLSRNSIRERVYIADKLPQYLIKSLEQADKMLNESLARLKTDYIDYYLMHMLTDINVWERLKAMGIEEWIAKKLESGVIRNIGFSFHGETDMFMKLADAYDWDFCQIQYNYMDEHSQAGVRGLRYAHEKGLPVIVMEPLRGGKLVNMLPEAARREIANDASKRSAAELALGWLWNQPEVTCVLSGMNSIESVIENANAASRSSVGYFTDADIALLERVRKLIDERVKVHCTGCGYCLPCPQGVDIPGAFRCYNVAYTEKKFYALKEYLQCTAMRKNPSCASQCIGCGKCESHCPQGIHIRDELQNARRELEIPIFRFAKFCVRLLKMW